MDNGKSIIYISKRCEYCIELLKILRNRPDIRGSIEIVSIDDNPFPKYVKAVPCMVSDNELYSATEIFTMLEESNDSRGDGSRQQPQPQPQPTGGKEGGGERQCNIDGYCKGDICLGFSSINEIDDQSLDSYYSTIDKDVQPGKISPGSSDDYKNKKKSSFDSEYEKMMNERGEMNGGQQPQQINFSR